MHPILLQWNNWIIPSWHFFLVLGICIAFVSALRLSSKHHPEVSGVDLRVLMAIIYVAGYLGSRGLSMWMFDEPVSSLWTFGRMTLYGGLLLGAFCGFIFVYMRRLPKQILWNLAGISILLGIGLGRIGCFLNGDDFGRVISFDSFYSFLGVSFPNLEDPENGIIRHPVQLYESFFALGMGIFCYVRYPFLHKKFPAFGFVLLAYYAVLRFFTEFFRADNRGELFGTGLSPSQEISLLVLMGLCIVFVANFQKQKQR